MVIRICRYRIVVCKTNGHKRKRHKKKHLIGLAHGGSFITLGEVCREAKTTFWILYDATEIPPFFEYFLRRMFGLNVKILVQVTLHVYSMNQYRFNGCFLCKAILTFSILFYFMFLFFVEEEKKSRRIANLNGERR